MHMSVLENAGKNHLMLVQTIEEGLPCSFFVYVDRVKDNLIYKDCSSAMKLAWLSRFLCHVRLPLRATS